MKSKIIALAAFLGLAISSAVVFPVGHAQAVQTATPTYGNAAG